MWIDVDCVVVACLFLEVMMRIFLIVLISTSSATADELRGKRQINSIPLIYPYGGTYKLLLGFALPVPNKDKIDLLFAANFQYQYLQFTNVSQLSQYYFIKEVSREQRDAEVMGRGDERLVFYRAAAEMMTARGMNGPECLLRAICEAAQFPVEDEGFIGEMLHILLTPDYGKSPFEELDPAWKEAMSEYTDAATAGRQMFSCADVYRGCPGGSGLMEQISTLKDD